MRWIWAVLVVALLAAGMQAWAEEAKKDKAASPLMLTPDTITFAASEGSAEVKVCFGTTPARSAQVTRAWIMDKAWMFKVTKSKEDPAVVTVATLPDKVEAGSYTLAVTAGGQTEYVAIRVDLKSPLDGLATFALPARLELDSSYAKGTTLTYTIESAPPEASYQWIVNKKTVLQGKGLSTLTHTFEAAGPCTIQLVVTKPNGETLTCKGTTKVTP